MADGLDERLMARAKRVGWLTGGPLLHFVAIVVSLKITGGAGIAVGIYLVTLIYYVALSSLGRSGRWRLH